MKELSIEEKAKAYDEALAWLKNLKERVRPQNTWKSNDEQMEALSIYAG